MSAYMSSSSHLDDLRNPVLIRDDKIKWLDSGIEGQHACVFEGGMGPARRFPEVQRAYWRLTGPSRAFHQQRRRSRGYRQQPQSTLDPMQTYSCGMSGHLRFVKPVGLISPDPCATPSRPLWPYDPENLHAHPGFVWVKSGYSETIAWRKVRLTKQSNVDLTTDRLWAMPLNTGWASQGTQAAGLGKTEKICSNSQAGGCVPQWGPCPCGPCPCGRGQQWG